MIIRITVVLLTVAILLSANRLDVFADGPESVNHPANSGYALAPVSSGGILKSIIHPASDYYGALVGCRQTADRPHKSTTSGYEHRVNTKVTARCGFIVAEMAHYARLMSSNHEGIGYWEIPSSDDPRHTDFEGFGVKTGVARSNGLCRNTWYRGTGWGYVIYLPGFNPATAETTSVPRNIQCNNQ